LVTAPVRLRRVASGLMIEKVRSVAMAGKAPFYGGWIGALSRRRRGRPQAAPLYPGAACPYRRSMNEPALTLSALAKTLPGGRKLFDGVDLALAPGEHVAVRGESGVGKSTLLNIIAGLDEADAGEVATTSSPGCAATGSASCSRPSISSPI
jgi:ABC-type glutathione transport system ATPase component